MQKRLAIVLGIVVVYRFLAHIPVPLAEPTKLKEVIESVVNSTDFGGFLNLLLTGRSQIKEHVRSWRCV